MHHRGPTCDSVDLLYEKVPYSGSPLAIATSADRGDRSLYATVFSVGFNGYPPLRQYVI